MYKILFPVSALCLVILLLILLLKRYRQPYLIAYILAGLLLGPGAGKVISQPETIYILGDLGILLLMFFLGMEIDIPDSRTLLLQPLIAQAIKILLCTACAWLAGIVFHWNTGNILILSILLIFNSTAVVSEFLRRTDELRTAIGTVVLNMLLLQDILVAPVFTFFQSMGRLGIEWGHLLPSIAGCALLFFLLRAIRNRDLYQWSGWKDVEKDHDIQVFAGAFICLGFALLANWAGLSGPVGSFAAGLLIGRTRRLHWLGHVLKPFKVFFTGLFFVSIGLMLDLSYMRDNLLVILSITFAILVINSLLSAIVFRMLGHAWTRSLYAGALLSQTGELGLLACSIAYKSGMIDGGFYKTCLAVTGLSLLLSTAWMTVLRKWTRPPADHPANSKNAENENEFLYTT